MYVPVCFVANKMQRKSITGQGESIYAA